VCVSCSSVLSFILYRKFFPAYVSICYIAMLLLVVICTIPYAEDVFKKKSFFYSVRGIGTFLNMGIIFFAANTKHLRKSLDVFYFICLVFIIGGLVNLSKVGIGASRYEYLFAIRDLTVALVWIFPFFFLQDEPDKKKNLLNMAVFFIIFIFVLSTGARTYLAIYFIYVMVKFREQLQKKGSILAIIGVAAVLLGGYFLLMNTGYSTQMQGAVDILSERSDKDSRSGQIIEFVQQWDTDYLVQGVGPLKSWFWTVVEDYYYFLDNQFLLLGWWAGLPVLFIYLFFLAKNYFTNAEVLLFEEVKGLRLIIALWVLGCLGFAIYITISPDIYYYFISIIMGIQVCRYSRINDPELEFKEA
jgi:hypothetical protein